MEEIWRVKDGIPTDEELEELADQFGQNWKKLGRRLDVPEPKLEEIDHAHGQISEKGYFMLKYWKQKKGSAATYQALCDALEHKLVQRQDLAEKFCYIHEPTIVRSRQLPVGHIQEERASGEVTHGASAGVYSGTSGQHRDNSSRVRRHLKRKSLDPNPERGNLSWKISCFEAISKNSGNQDLREEREKVNRYMEEKIDEVTSERTFDLSTFKGIHRFNAYLTGERCLMDVNFQRSSIKVTVKCGTLEILEDLWHDYWSGHLNGVAEECLITEQVKEELGMETIKLKTTILEEDYVACKLSLMETAGNVDFGKNTQNMAIPLCLPNNYQWNAARGECIKTGERRSSLYVVEDALQKLRTIKGPVCVVSIAGSCRTGKSYILSKAFDQPEVFPLGHKMFAETIGIWMWVVPQTMLDSNGQDCTVVLLDSEAIDAFGGEGLDDDQIFTITVLLSSVLIFNSRGVPRRRDVERMDFIIKLPQRIEVRSSSGRGSMRARQEDTEFFHRTFPFFIWLLRDVMQSLPPDCKDFTEYFLTKVFKGQGSSRVDHNQRVAESILRFFPGFRAFCLPPPTNDVEVLKHINRTYKSQINSEFLSGIEKLKEFLRTTLIPKRSFNDGEIVTGEGLGALVQLYVEAINSPGVIPNVQTAWETFAATKCSKAANAALNAYDTIMTSRLAGQLPCDNKEIRKSHKAALGQGITQLEAETTGISAVTTETYRRELTRYKAKPIQNQDKGIPLCLPNNVSWNPATGKVTKTSDDRRSLHPVPAAVEMLQQIKEPVCVVSIAGPCRDGKSYILGAIFGKMEIFPVGRIVDPETTGIWMWIAPQTFKDSRGREFKVILLDSEGINAVTAEGQNDHQIFTLTVLLASILIYNSKGVPKRTDLDDLGFIVKLSQRIRIRSKGSHDDKDKFRDTFPFFFWLLRDISQRLPPDCSDFNQFFSTRVFKDSCTSEDQRKVAESILSFFSGFESFALPVPSEDEDIMQDISKHWERLNPKFRAGVKNFESLLKTKLVPKNSINQGEYVTGEALGALVHLYTEAINDPGAIPNVETAWDTFVITKCAEARKGAFQIYHERMTQLMSERLPCDNGEIQKNHETAQRESMEKFESETDELISKAIREEWKKLTKSIEKKLFFWKDKNATLTQDFCHNLLERLKNEHLDPVLKKVGGPDGAKVSYDEIMGGWSKIKTEFTSKAVGAKDVMADVFFKYNQYLEEEVLKYKDILRKMKDYDENVSKEKIAKAFVEKERRRLEENLAAKVKQDEEWQRKMDVLVERQKVELERINEQAKKNKEDLEKQIKLMKDADMKAQEKLQKQLDAARENEKQAHKTLQDLKHLLEQSNYDAQAEREAANLKFKQMEKDNMEIQAELKSQLSAMALRETENNKRLNDLTEIWKEEREEAAAMRNDIRVLQGKLDDANKPGFIRRIWRKIF